MATAVNGDSKKDCGNHKAKSASNRLQQDEWKESKRERDRKGGMRQRAHQHPFLLLWTRWWGSGTRKRSETKLLPRSEMGRSTPTMMRDEKVNSSFGTRWRKTESCAKYWAHMRKSLRRYQIFKFLTHLGLRWKFWNLEPTWVYGRNMEVWIGGLNFKFEIWEFEPNDPIKMLKLWFREQTRSW